jgi:putative toxin-antitoxin system antitoxin component (TIGR02293 family)
MKKNPQQLPKKNIPKAKYRVKSGQNQSPAEVQEGGVVYGKVMEAGHPENAFHGFMVCESEDRLDGNPLAMVDRINAGLPCEEFDALRAMLGLTVEEMCQKIGLSTATLSRRRAKSLPLDRDHSDRLVRFARLYAKATGLFDGDTPSARRWLASPARSLEGRRPLDLAETELGAREVEDLIGRLNYGVYV